MSYSLEVKKNREEREDLSKNHLLFWASPSLLLYTRNLNNLLNCSQRQNVVFLCCIELSENVNLIVIGDM